MYVLDRLLSLQLGRPPAIHDDDCHHSLPWRIDDTLIDWDGDQLVSDNPPEDTQGGDYFLHVIEFSSIVGRVLRDIYAPRQARLARNELERTSELNRQLLDWKAGLPRTLRFDMGHAFEKSLMLKRQVRPPPRSKDKTRTMKGSLEPDFTVKQRTMLAVKFHHLRALIHRPYLCFPLLRHMDSASMTLLQVEGHLISRYEQICISEARATAHMLHNVASERDLVHDFPCKLPFHYYITLCRYPLSYDRVWTLEKVGLKGHPLSTR